MNKKIAIGFVVYNPNQDQLSRIYAASNLGYSLYVFDNSPEKDNCKEFAGNRLDIIYITCGKNVGLGRGMATICAQAYYDRNSALLFFDQDTIFTVDTLNFINEFYQNNFESLGSYSAISFNSKSGLVLKSAKKCNIKNVLLAINSGSLFFLEKLYKMKWHNDSYFVDCVDYEFCLNTKMHGFELGEVTVTPGFDHSTEQEDDEYLFFGRSYLMREYPYFRVIDTIQNSVKLIFKSLFAGELTFSFKIVRLFLIYFLTQILVRSLRFFHGNKNVGNS